ncbi:MAG TPA: hypothetical protein VL860_14740, partial [Planctomycetota bacterium]|nr:hypothetical protein [Planctomycetota bacterium]
MQTDPMPAHLPRRLITLGCAGSCAALGLMLLPVVESLAGRLYAADESPEQLVDSLYGPDLKKAKGTPDTKDDLALADKLIGDAKTAGKNKGFQLALLKRAVLLALEDPDGAPTAQAATEMIVAAQALPAVAAWQDLTDKAAAVLRRRNLGKADKLLEADFAWLMQLSRAALAAGDSAFADRVLAALIRDAQTNRFKLVADEAQQLQAEIRFMAPFQSAAKRELAKIKPGAEDPKMALQVAEAVLGQTGDWEQAAPLLRSANDPRWNLVAHLRELRLHPPAPPAKPGEGEAKPAGDEPKPVAETPKPPVVAEGPAPVGVVATAPTTASASAIELLTEQTMPAKHPSPAGKLFLASEASLIAAQAAAADQSRLSTAQKMDLAKAQRSAQDVLSKAQEEYATAFERVLRLSWVPLLSRNLQADWVQIGTGTKWEILGGDELKGNGDWDSCLRSSHVKPGDFVMECEFQRRAEEAHAFLLFREHSGPPVYSLEVGEDHVHLLFAKGGGAEEREVAKHDPGSPRDRWCKLKLAADGDHL